MNATTNSATAASTSASAQRTKSAGFWSDLTAVALRACRLTLREPESFGPALAIPIFFLIVNVGALQDFVGANAGIDYKAFQLPVSVVFAVTGISRASSLVTDIQDGYFDHLLLTPVRRATLLLGLMVADLMLIMMLCIPVVVIGLLIGVSFQAGILGMLAFILIGGLWGLAFTGLPYAIALKTANAAAVNSSFLLFFPFAFLTSAYVPEQLLTGWLGTVAKWNPVTYLLRGLRALVMEGWNWTAIGQALLAIAGLGALSFTLAFRSLQGRVARK